MPVPSKVSDDGPNSPLGRAERMLSWLKEHGGTVHPFLEIRQDPQYGLSLFTSSPIPPGTTLVSCPFDLAITPSSATEAICDACNIGREALIWPDGSEGGRDGERWNERMLVCAYVCLCRAAIQVGGGQEDESLIHIPYISSLPEDDQLLTPLYFGDHEFELLRGTNMYGAVLDKRKELEAESRVVQTVLDNGLLHWSHYLSAATYISSRAFPSKLLDLGGSSGNEVMAVGGEEGDIESHPVLLAGVDMLNHARGHPITWLSSELLSASGASKTIPSVSLINPGGIPKDGQVFNNYGPKSNEELLMAYGFVLDHNPDDFVVLKLGASVILPAKREKCREKALDPEKRFMLRRDGEMDPELLKVMRVLLSLDVGPEREREKDEEEEGAHLHAAEERDLQLELDVLGALGQMLEDKLVKLQEPVVGGSRAREEEVRRMCEVYRRGQVEILETAMDKLGDRVEKFERLVDEGTGCECCL